jgi:hypothetical protein
MAPGARQLLNYKNVKSFPNKSIRRPSLKIIKVQGSKLAKLQNA